MNSQQDNATITLTVKIKTPAVPDYLDVTGLKHPTLDEAIAHNGKVLSIDVADMDDAALEALGRQWTNALISKAKARRNKVV